MTAPQSILREPKVDGERVTARLSIDRDDFDLFYETSGHAPSTSADAFVVASLIPAMEAGMPLVVEGSVSRRLLDSLPDAQAILTWWEPKFRQIEVRADAAGEHPRVEGSGAFFSLGVDSFFTLQERKDELTHLIMVKGYDAAYLDDVVWNKMFENARRVAEESGKDLIEVETNVRDLATGASSWRWLHGAALASVGHVLNGTLGTVHVSASQSYDHLGAWGTHPMLDHLWSSGSLDVQHSGATHNRVEKTVLVSEDPLVLDTLRVCLVSDGRDYNCGRCSKCLGVMTTLEAVGTLKACKTFPDTVDVAAISDLNLNVGNRIYYFELTLDLLRQGKRDPQLIRALHRRLQLSKLKTTALGAFLGRLNNLLGSPVAPLRWGRSRG